MRGNILVAVLLLLSCAFALNSAVPQSGSSPNDEKCVITPLNDHYVDLAITTTAPPDTPFAASATWNDCVRLCVVDSPPAASGYNYLTAMKLYGVGIVSCDVGTVHLKVIGSPPCESGASLDMSAFASATPTLAAEFLYG